MILTISIYLCIALALLVGLSFGAVGGASWEHGRRYGSYYWRHRAHTAERVGQLAIKQRNEAREAARQDRELAHGLTRDIDRLTARRASQMGGDA